MAGEHHVDAGRLRRRRDILVHGGTAAGGIGVIGGLVDREDLPGGVAGLRILHQPIRRGLHVAADTAVVDDGHIDITIGGGPIAARTVGGQGKHAAGDVGIAVALKLMVAQDVDHVGAAQLSSVQQLDHLVQLGELCGLIHSVTGLDTEIVAAGSQLFENMSDIGHIIGLDVAQHEELLGRISRDSEALHRLRPVVARPGLILIGRAGGQTSQRNAVHFHRIVAVGGKSTQFLHRRNGDPFLLTLHTVAQELSLRYRRIGQPSNILCRAGAFRGIEEECGLLKRHRRIGIHPVAHGKASIRGPGVDGDHAYGAEHIAGQRTVLTGRSQERIIVVLENLCAGYRLAIQVDDLQHGTLAGQHRSAGHADGRAHRQRHLGGGGGDGAVVRIAAHDGFDLIGKRTAVRQVFGDLHLYRGNELAALGRSVGRVRSGIALTHGANFHGVFLCVVAILGVIVGCGFKIRGELHSAITILRSQPDDRFALFDAAVGSLHLQRRIPAHGSHRLHMGHADGVLRAAVRHGEVAGLGSLIAEAIAEGHCDGMSTVGKLQIIQVNMTIASHQHSIVRHVDTVHIETNGFGVHAGGIFTRRVAEIGTQVEGAAIDCTAVRQVLVVEGNGVYLRVVNIVRICTVHKLEVVQIDRPNPGLDHLCTIDKHEAEGHTLLQGKGGSRCIQPGLAVLPALPVDTRLIIRCISVIFWLNGIVELFYSPILTIRVSPQPKAGICSFTLPCNADALGGIDPYAKARGNAWNFDIVYTADTRALGHRSAVAEVEVQLQGFRAEAYRFTVIDTDDLNRLFAAAVIVICTQNARFQSVPVFVLPGKLAMLSPVTNTAPRSGHLTGLYA